MNSITSEYRGFLTRPLTWDNWVVDEVGSPDIYSRPLALIAGDVVLDIGMNIGIFSVMASKVGCKVYGYEPDRKNFELAESNISKNGVRVEAHNKAVFGWADRRRLYHHPTNLGAHTTLNPIGYDFDFVSGDGINEVLLTAPFTKIKMDCEGGEYEIIMACKDWGRVSRIRFEWHWNLLNDKQFDEVLKRLTSDGFIVDVTGDRERTLTQMVTAVR